MFQFALTKFAQLALDHEVFGTKAREPKPDSPVAVSDRIESAMSMPSSEGSKAHQRDAAEWQDEESSSICPQAAPSKRAKKPHPREKTPPPTNVVDSKTKTHHVQEKATHAEKCDTTGGTHSAISHPSRPSIPDEYFYCAIHGPTLEKRILSSIEATVARQLDAERPKLVEDVAAKLLPHLQQIVEEAAAREIDSFVKEVQAETENEQVRAITQRMGHLSRDMLQRVFLQKSVMEILKNLVDHMELELALLEWEEF